MWRLGMAAGLWVLACGSAWAQNDPLTEAAQRIKYAPLAAQARIQGDVRVRLDSEGVTVLSGHPLLVPGAKENFIRLGTILGKDGEAIYHFVLPEPGSQATTVKKGDAFDRLILRALRLPTERIVYVCTPVPGKETRVYASQMPIEVWVYGPVYCLTTESAEIASR